MSVLLFPPPKKKRDARYARHTMDEIVLPRRIKGERRLAPSWAALLDWNLASRSRPLSLSLYIYLYRIDTGWRTDSRCPAAFVIRSGNHPCLLACLLVFYAIRVDSEFGSWFSSDGDFSSSFFLSFQRIVLA